MDAIKELIGQIKKRYLPRSISVAETIAGNNRRRTPVVETRDLLPGVDRLGTGIRKYDIIPQQQTAHFLQNSLQSPRIIASILLFSMESITYGAIVIGAGPGGLATLAALCDPGLEPILWIDRTFEED